MIKYYEQPKKITLKEMLDYNTDRFAYIRRIEYGDYDNWTDTIVKDMTLHCKNLKQMADGTYDVDFKVEFVRVSDNREFVGYSINHKIKTLEDIENIEFEVVGEWTSEE